MAKNVLPTNFKDDILNSSMGGKRRYRETTNSDGTVSLEDASVYDQVGSNFGAGQINATNTAVNESADKNTIIDNIDDIAANTKDGMIAGALALKELNSNLGNIVINDSVLVTVPVSLTDLKRYSPGAGTYIITASLAGATGHSMKIAIKQNNTILSNATIYSGAEMSAEANCTALCTMTNTDSLTVCANCGVNVTERPLLVSIMRIR